MEEISKLVNQAKSGNNEAFDKLYALTEREVWFTCITLIKNEENAKDIMQDTYFTAFLKLATLTEPSKFAAWVKKIAVNKCKDFFKTKQELGLDEETIENFAEMSEITIPEEYIANNEKRRIILELMVSTLSEVQYRTVFMYYFDELSVTEIAAITDSPEGTVMSRLNLARIKMKKAITEYEEKNNDKLYAIVPVPFFISFFKAEAESMNIPPIDLNFSNMKVSGSTSKSKENNPANGGKNMLKSTTSKIIAGICAGVVVIGGIAGIVIATGNNSNNGTSSNSSNSSNSSDNSNNSDNQSGIESVNYSLDNQVLFDNDKCTLTVTGCESTDDSFIVNMEFLNKTSDETISVESEEYYTYVNGYAMDYKEDPFRDPYNTPNDDGEPDELHMEFLYSDLKQMNITSIDEISFKLDIYNEDDYHDYDNYYCNEMKSIYPTGKKAEDIKVQDRITTDKEEVVVDNEFGTVVFLGTEVFDGNGGKYVKFNYYIENKTEYNIEFNFLNARINDNNATSLNTNFYVEAGKRLYYDPGYMHLEDYEAMSNADGANEVTVDLVIGKFHSLAWSFAPREKALFEDKLTYTIR